MAPQDEAQIDPQAAPRRTGRIATFAVVAVVMLLEGGAIFFAVKMMYQQPKAVEASDDGTGALLSDIQHEVEITLPEMNAFNKRQGRMMLCSMEIALRVERENEDTVRKAVTAREGTIMDRINTVIRAAEGDVLSEPGLDTLRDQFKKEFDRILGDPKLIRHVLVRRFYQSPADL